MTDEIVPTDFPSLASAMRGRFLTTDKECYRNRGTLRFNKSLKVLQFRQGKPRSKGETVRSRAIRSQSGHIGSCVA